MFLALLNLLGIFLLVALIELGLIVLCHGTLESERLTNGGRDD
jgi:hypothetical protein